MKKRIIKAALIVGLIVLVLLAGIGLAQLAVVNQPAAKVSAQPEDLPTGNRWVKVRLDENMFTLFAALNAAGYDKKGFDQPYHPVRQLVRERLAGKRFSGLDRLRSELNLVGVYSFVVWSLHYGPPPEFARVQAGWSDPSMPAFLFFGLDSQIRSFYKEMDIANLWQEVRPQYEQEAARYQEAAGQAVQAALDYTRLKDVPLKQVVVIPNLLDAHWSGFGPTIGDAAYVVIGPTQDQPDVGLVQHEALHSIVGPLIEANLSVIDENQSAMLYNELRKRVPSSYGSWENILEEQVVRAIICRVSGPLCEQYGLIENDEAQGFLLERTLVNSLVNFEQGSSTLAEFMPELLRSLNDVKLAD